MSRNRYMKIKKYLHFNDNSCIQDEHNTDKALKITPLFEMINKQFLKYGVFSKYISIDEQMIRYYGHHYFKQFLKGKPIRLDFK